MIVDKKTNGNKNQYQIKYGMVRIIVPIYFYLRTYFGK